MTALTPLPSPSLVAPAAAIARSPRRRAKTIVAALLAALAARAAVASAQPSPRSLTLDDAIAIARRNAPSVHAALARSSIAEARIDLARAATLPVLSATGTAEAFVSDGSLYNRGVRTEDRNQQFLTADASLGLAWTLTDFGRTSRATRAASLRRDGAQIDVRASELAAATAAALAFYVVLFDDDLRAAAQTTVDQRERQLATTRALVAAGVRSPIDQTRTQVALDAAMLDLASADANARIDAAELAAALALEPTARVRLARPRDADADDDATRAADDALRESPRIRALAQRVEAARAQSAAARAARHPSIEGHAGAGTRYTRGPDLRLGSPAQQAAAYVTLTVPIFDPAIGAQVRSADGEVALAEAELARETLAIRSEAAKAALQVSLARAILTRAERMETGARANLALVEARYASGLLGPLELLDAQNVDAVARVATVRSRRDVELAKVRLLGATGRLIAR